jgi:hypothetical protein
MAPILFLKSLVLTNDFSGVEISPFCQKEKSKATWSRELFSKNHHISKKKVLKSPRFLEVWGEFFTFLL